MMNLIVDARNVCGHLLVYSLLLLCDVLPHAAVAPTAADLTPADAPSLVAHVALSLFDAQSLFLSHVLVPFHAQFPDHYQCAFVSHLLVSVYHWGLGTCNQLTESY